MMANRRLAIAGCVAAFAMSYASVASPAPLVFGLISQLIFLLPGALIVRAMTPCAGWLAALTYGPAVGQALGSLMLTLLWVAGGRESWLMIGAPLLAATLAWPARRLAGRFRLPVTEPGDSIALAALLFIVPVIAGLPFAHVGEITANGVDYRAYFTADYVWRRAVVIELAKGDMLPVNPYYAGDALHYYWMPHVLSAVQYRFAGAWATLDELLLVRSISIDAVFVAFLYGMIRTFGVRAWASAAAVAFVIMASSFEGLYALFDYARHGVPLRDVKNLNIDAISRWWFQGIPIDGLQRLLFYQPHHAVGYVIGFIGLLAIARRDRERDATAFAVAGACLGLSIAISSFAGGMVTVGAAIYEGAAVLRRLDFRRAFVHAAAAAVPLTAAVAVTYALRYVDTSGSVVALELNRMAVRDFFRVTLLSFGPVLLLSLAALTGLRRDRRGVGIFGALAVSCVIFYFLVNVRDHQDVYVGWRVGHFMFMAATVMIGLLFERISALPAPQQKLGWAAVALMLAMGLPTTAIDVYNTQDITNHGPAPAGRWTLRLSPDDRQVFDWIRHNTDPKSIFQLDPAPRDPETWGYLPAFAERRMAAGLPISMIPLRKYQEASHDVRLIYDEPPLLAYERSRKAGIDYIIVGPPERAVHPGVEERFDSVKDLLPLAFRNGTIAIYQVRR